MGLPALLAALLLAIVPGTGLAASETDAVSADAYAGFISRVQDRLRELGFAPGPTNGDFGAETQAALAQFQLSRVIPASGQLDDQTLGELGVARDEQTSETQDAAAAAGSSSLKP